jgi:P pilus assembly chaperone PapD
MKAIGSLFCVILLLASASAFADMYVDRSIVIFEPSGPPRQDVKVSNSGSDVLYVKVDVLRVDNPGTSDEKRVKVTDPKDLKLLATPSKLIIPAGGQKLVRIVNLQTSNKAERVYRINVTPVVAPLEEKSNQLRIVVAYQVLTIVQPNHPQSTLSATRNGNTISFSNPGNTNVLLSEGKQCDPQDKQTCKDLPSKRLYAGNDWQLDLPYDAPVTFSVRSFDGVKTQVFP